MRPARIDLAIAAVLLGLGVAGLISDPPTDSPVWASAVLTAAYAAPFALRSRVPLPVAAVAICSIVALGLIASDGSQPSIPLAVALAAYTLGHDVAPPRSEIATLALLAVFLGAQAGSDMPAADLLFTTALLFGGPWLFGRTLRRRSEHAGELVREAEARERRAVEAERHRIARELHDVVSHSISVVSVQTQSVRRRLGDDHRREADDLRAVEATVRQAMVEMRRLFGVLRGGDEAAPLAPQPGLAQLDQLLSEARDAGLRVELREEGARPALAPGVDLAAYRIVQEALTNVRRHAPGAVAQVELRYAPDALVVEVADDGSPVAANGSGHGLIGMRERVALYGGELVAGPGQRGGWHVRATLPLREEAA